METVVAMETVVDDGGQHQLIIENNTVPSRLKWKISLTAISAVSGVVCFVLFTCLNNFAAASGCFLLVLICYPLVRLYHAMLRGKLQEKYNSTWLLTLTILAVWIGVASFAVAGTFAGLAVTFEQGFRLERDGYYVAAVPSTLALVWSVVLAVECVGIMQERSPADVTPPKPFSVGECLCQCIGGCLQALAH